MAKEKNQKIQRAQKIFSHKECPKTTYLLFEGEGKYDKVYNFISLERQDFVENFDTKEEALRNALTTNRSHFQIVKLEIESRGVIFTERIFEYEFFEILCDGCVRKIKFYCLPHTPCPICKTKLDIHDSNYTGKFITRCHYYVLNGTDLQIPIPSRKAFILVTLPLLLSFLISSLFLFIWINNIFEYGIITAFRKTYIDDVEQIFGFGWFSLIIILLTFFFLYKIICKIKRRLIDAD